MRRMARWVSAVAVVVLVGALSLVAISGGRGGRPADAGPTFVKGVDNPYFPLVPGRTLVYRGIRDGRMQVDRVTTASRTKTVDGVEATVVRDVAKHGDRLVEKTFDWYAQDDQGNVWYLGENTKEYDADGHVASTEGSWEAGVDGASPGIVMEADPAVADGYRQEYYAGHAEDQAWILHVGGKLHLPYGNVHHVLRTMEWTRLEPRVVDEKWYAPGLGIVYETTAAGGKETAALVKVVGP